MNNNYYYLEQIKTNQEEQEKLKKELKADLVGLILEPEEEENLISETLEKAIHDYQPNSVFNFKKFLKIRMKKVIEEKFFTKSNIFSINDQKIIKLYLTSINNRFLSEEEIRKYLNVDSKTVYCAIKKITKKNLKELNRIFPNFKQNYLERKSYSNQPITLSEKDILYIGYYIGEIDDLCLEIDEIAKIEQKSAIEIKNDLINAFRLLKNDKNLSLLLEKYPNCHQMLNLKATKLGIHLPTTNTTKKHSKKNTKITKKEKEILTDTEKKLIEEIKKHSSDEIFLDIIAKNLNKTENQINNMIYKLKKKCEQNDVKVLIQQQIPNFLKIEFKKSPKISQNKAEKNASEKKYILPEKKLKLLTILSKNPNISRKELAKKAGYKNSNVVITTLTNIKRKCNQDPDYKKEILNICPNLFIEKKRQKEKRHLTSRQIKLLEQLNNHKQNHTTYKEIAKLVGYKNEQTVCQSIKILIQKGIKNSEVRKEIEKIYPEFFLKKEKQLLTSKQIKLLEQLNIYSKKDINYKEIAKLTGYKNKQTVCQTISNLKKRGKNNAEIKKEIEKICPEFLEPKDNQEKSIDSKQDTTLKASITLKDKVDILKKVYLITPPDKTYATQREIAKEFHLTPSAINHIKKRALEKIEQNPNIENKIKEFWPSFEEDRIIRENYSKTRSIKVQEKDLENIKNFIRQYDISDIEHKEKKNGIIMGINNLENSIFSPYVSKCTQEQKAILALRLGYINAPLKSKDIADIFHIEEEEVILLTKNCLQSRIKTTNKVKKK